MGGHRTTQTCRRWPRVTGGGAGSFRSAADSAGVRFRCRAAPRGLVAVLMLAGALAAVTAAAGAHDAPGAVRTAGAESAPPAAPTGLSAAAGDASVTLEWDDPADSSITGYEYQYRYAGVGWGAWTAIRDSSASTTSHTVAGLDNGTEYRFHLRAVNADGAGAQAPDARPWYVSATPQSPPPAASKPNVVVIFADDLGYNDVSFNGATDIDTPNIDRLADTGVTFTRGYVAAPVCTPSRVGLLTGRYPMRSGVQVNWKQFPQDPADPLYGMSPAEKSVAAYLADAGYRTGAVGKWQIGAAEGLQPTDRGFDYFYGMLGGGHLYFSGNDATSNNEYYYPLSEDVPHHWLLGSRHSQLVDFTEQKPYLTDALTDKAVQFVAAAATAVEPWFLYLAYNAPHTPLEAPAVLRQKYLDAGHDNERATYLAMVDSLDQNVGRVLDAIDDAGERDDTLIFFLSDNGGLAGTHDWADNGVLKHGKGTYYEGGIRVPFVASWPGRWPAGITYDKPVVSLDIAATAMAMAGVTPDAELPLDGVNLDGYVRSAATGSPHEALFWHWWQPWNNGNDSSFAVVSGDLKLVKDGAAGPVGLFDLAVDPGETVDLFDETSTVPSQARADAERLRGLWNAWNRANLVSLYPTVGEYASLVPRMRAAKTREFRCRNAKLPLMQIGTDFQTTPTQQPSAPARAAAQVSALAPGSAPVLSVEPFGGATWDYLLPPGHTLSYIQVRWRPNDAPDINDWTSHSSQVFYSECVYSWRIPDLSLGTEYKAKVFIGATADDGTVKYLKSNTAVFTPIRPTLQVTSAGAASWSYELAPQVTLDYVQLRWRFRGDEPIDDWTGHSSQLFWDDSVSSWQIPDLTEGTRYKAKLFVGARDPDGTRRYLKSDTVVFTASG